MATEAPHLELELLDGAARAAALDPTRSFLVRAPAGSGKTELLTQRFLALLATVEAPEAIWAMTFTRKAAAEMRGRILGALQRAAGPMPASEHERQTWELARAAGERAQARDWQLEAAPARLKIQTLDSLALSLAQRLPLRAGLGAAPAPTESAPEMYRAAAAACLRGMGSNRPHAAAARRLLEHTDADLERAELLLADMLSRRDAWPELLLADPCDIAAAAKRELARLIEARLNKARDALAPWAGTLAAIAGLDALPAATAADLEPWRRLAALILTDEATPRKRADAKAGLDAAGAKCLKALGLDSETCHALHATRNLPAVAEFELETALLELLRPAAAALQLEFAARGECDFAEIALRACQALDGGDVPSTLAFALDTRLQHILVDEFQDTSAVHCRLLELLTSEWQPDKSRSLFLVGDPMQSIHRFRNARVERFLAIAAAARLGTIALEPLQLARNFRSQEPLVHWANRVFAQILPSADHAESGAAKFGAAVPVHNADPAAGMDVHAAGAATIRSEAGVVAELAGRELAAGNADVAILVRARSHLRAIMPELRRRGVPFEAVRLWMLKESPVARDLLALTRAVYDPADRIAWLAALRAPWCGLTLTDLHAICGDLPREDRRTLTELYFERAAQLSPDGRKRSARTMAIMQAAARERGRVPARRLIAWCWQALGCATCLTPEANPADADVMLELIETHDHGDGTLDLDRIEHDAADLKAAPDPVAGPRVRVMTLHQAKGLEFDTVILPGLGRPPRPDNPRLLHWIDHPATATEAARFLLAATPPRGGESRVCTLVKEQQRPADEQEILRLLYVAATRAKRKLHLVAGLTRLKDGQIGEPRRGSLLHPLWPVIGAELTRQATGHAGDPPAAAVPRRVLFRRVAGDWVAPAPATEVVWHAAAPAPPPAAMLPLHGAAAALARQLGTAAHFMLQRLAGRAPLQWSTDEVKQALWTAGVGPADWDAARQRLEAMMTRTVGDERGRWVLARHVHAHCEWAIQGVVKAGLRRAIVDRSFVENGVRWVIDYKTGSHEGGAVAAFLDAQVETYREQLEGYAELLKAMEVLPVRCGLFFPALGAWREWSPQA